MNPFEDDPFHQGFAACAAGKAQTDNPYDAQSDDGRRWLEGYAAATLNHPAQG